MHNFHREMLVSLRNESTLPEALLCNEHDTLLPPCGDLEQQRKKYSKYCRTELSRNIILPALILNWDPAKKITPML